MDQQAGISGARVACGQVDIAMYNEIFFTNVLRLSDDLGISKIELANRAGISCSFLSDLTNGRANPSLKIMESLAMALGMPLPALLEMTDLDRATLRALSTGSDGGCLTAGFIRSAAILTEYQAFVVSQWDQENRQAMARTTPPHPRRSKTADTVIGKLKTD